jgi:hypothetical protein
MKKLNRNIVLLLLISILIGTSCSSSKGASGKNCGCPSKKGMVGY